MSRDKTATRPLLPLQESLSDPAMPKSRRCVEPVSFREIVSGVAVLRPGGDKYEMQTIRCSGGVRGARAGSARVGEAWGSARQHAAGARRCRASGEVRTRARPWTYASRRPRPPLWMAQRPRTPLRLASSPPLLGASLVNHCPNESGVSGGRNWPRPPTRPVRLRIETLIPDQPRPISTAIRIKSEWFFALSFCFSREVVLATVL